MLHSFLAPRRTVIPSAEEASVLILIEKCFPQSSALLIAPIASQQPVTDAWTSASQTLSATTHFVNEAVPNKYAPWNRQTELVLFRCISPEPTALREDVAAVAHLGPLDTAWMCLTRQAARSRRRCAPAVGTHRADGLDPGIQFSSQLISTRSRLCPHDASRQCALCS